MRVLDNKRIILEIGTTPVVRETRDVEELVEGRKLSIAQAIGERHLELKPGDAFASAEELVQRDPELQLLVTGLGILRPIAAIDSLHAGGKISGEATWHDAKIEGLPLVHGGEVARAGIIRRLQCAETRDARAREAQLGMTPMH